MQKTTLLTGLIGLVLMFSCKKPSGDVVAPPPQQQQQKLVTAVGTPDGTPVSKAISAAAGGAVSSTDGRISISIPAGALPADQAITIQPISNATGVGLGKAYRITPHDIQFSKPVSIVFHYSDAELKGTAPELMAIAYQDNTRAWQWVTNATVDKNAKTITVTTTHFSDWGFFPLVSINPVEVTMQEGERLNMSVQYLANPGDIDVPSPNGTTPLSEPFTVADEYVKHWGFAGPGTLSQQGARAVYNSPAKVTTQNTVAVNAEIFMHKKGTFILVSNITIVSDFHIDYMQVDEREMNTNQLSYISRMYVYGKFSPDPGADNRSVTINGIPVQVAVWSPAIIICDIPAIGVGSSGDVVVTSGNQKATRMLNEWTVELNYEKVECPGGNLTKDITFIIRLRGDAQDYGSDDIDPLITETEINKSSKAIVNVHAGSYSNAVNNEEACGTFHVTWGQVKDYVEERKLSSAPGLKGFRGYVKFGPAGFTIQLQLETDYILKSTRSFAGCDPKASYGPDTFDENIWLGSWQQKEIVLEFSNNSARSPIKAGSIPLETGTGVATGLYWNGWEWPGVQNSLTTKMNWVETAPKFD